MTGEVRRSHAVLPVTSQSAHAAPGQQTRNRRPSALPLAGARVGCTALGEAGKHVVDEAFPHALDIFVGLDRTLSVRVGFNLGSHLLSLKNEG